MVWLTAKIWPWIVSAGLLALVVFMSRRNGKLSERVETSERKNDAQTRMREAVANTRTDRKSVVDSLRNGGQF